jgi:hypothetical protein
MGIVQMVERMERIFCYTMHGRQLLNLSDELHGTNCNATIRISDSN